MFTTFEGDNTVLMMLVAKGVLTDYKDHFGELDPAEMVTFVAGQAVETVVERLFARKIVQVIADVVPGPATTTGDLLEREHQLDLFRWREGHITASVAQRFKRGLDEGYRPVRGVPRGPEPRRRRRPAHTSTGWCSRRSQPAIERCEDESLRGALGLVCDLYALHQIESDTRVLPGARPAHRAAVQGDHARGQPAVQRGAAGRRRSSSTRSGSPTRCWRRRSGCGRDSRPSWHAPSS